MPSGPLQKLPTGLLGFFELKTGGKYPQSLGEELSPELSMFEWYMRTSEATFSAPPVAVAGTGFTTMSSTTPDTPWQYFNWVTAFSDVLGAGDTFLGCLAMATDLTTTVKFTQLSDYSALLTTGDQIMLSSRSGFFLPPNSALGMWTARFAGGYNFQVQFGRTQLDT